MLCHPVLYWLLAFVSTMFLQGSLGTQGPGDQGAKLLAWEFLVLEFLGKIFFHFLSYLLNCGKLLEYMKHLKFMKERVFFKMMCCFCC